MNAPASASIDSVPIDSVPIDGVPIDGVPIDASGTTPRVNELLLIGILLAYPQLLNLYETLEIRDFTTLPCQRVFEAMRNLQHNREAITIDAILATLGDRANALSDGRSDGSRLYLEERLLQANMSIETAQEIVEVADKIIPALQEQARADRDVATVALRDAERERAWEHEMNGDATDDKPRRPARKATTLAAAIRARSQEPWISLRLGDVEIARLRQGSVATLTGAPGAGKSTLAAAFVLDHVSTRGPAVYVSIELDADELAARMVGMQSNASWEDTLRGRVSDADMERALDLPRLSVLEGEDATLIALEHEVAWLREEYPNEPILAIVDYIQIVESDERDTRARIAAVAQRLRRIAKRLGIVVLGISQPSRVAGRQLSTGEMLGLDTMTAMAESAEIERAAYMTFALGSQGPVRDDGTCMVDLSTGKGRMGGGDHVWPISLTPTTGRLRVAGNAMPASEVRAERASKRNANKVEQVAHVVAGTLDKATEPMSVAALKKLIGGDGTVTTAAAKLCRDDGRAVRVRGKKSGGAWPLWTRERAQEHGLDIVPDGVE